MRTNRHGIAILSVLLVCLMMVVSACATTPVPTPVPTATEPSKITPLAPPTPTSTVLYTDGDTILSKRCTNCHTLERVSGSKKSRAQWLQTVNRMIPSLNPTEQAVLLDHLAKNYGP